MKPQDQHNSIAILARLKSWIRLHTGHLAKGYFRQCARRRIRREFPGSTFVGPYENSGVYMSLREEQWLWAHRDLIRGVVLDMSTPRYWHEWIYRLPTVEKVLISDLWAGEVERHGHRSKVDIIGDFATHELPVPEETFDTVLCLSILEHCEDPAAMMRNTGLILRAGGGGVVLVSFCLH